MREEEYSRVWALKDGSPRVLKQERGTISRFCPEDPKDPRPQGPKAPRTRGHEDQGLWDALSGFSSSDMCLGAWPRRAPKVETRILKWTQYNTGSWRKLFKKRVKWVVLFGRVKSLAAKFCTYCEQYVQNCPLGFFLFDAMSGAKQDDLASARASGSNRVPEIQSVDLKVSFLPEVLIFKSSPMWVLFHCC